MKKRIVVISDCLDIAFHEIRAQIYANVFGGVDFEIEPLAPIIPFSVCHASFIIRLLAESYPEGTIFCFIMNSIKERTERIIGITKIKNIVFEGTNTGAIGWLLRDFGCSQLYELYDSGFIPFGGKYVHAPAVGKYISGVSLNELGHPFPLEKVRDYKIQQGEIVHIDNFGNIKFPYSLHGAEQGNIYNAVIEDNLELLVVFWKRMMERVDNEWVLYPGSSFDFYEIGQVRAKGFLNYENIKHGMKLKLFRK